MAQYNNNNTKNRPHQDWEVVVLNKKAAAPPPGTTRQRLPAPAVSGVTGTLARKIEAQVDSDTGKPLTMVSSAEAKAIMQKRLAAKISQADLDKRLALKPKTVARIERCEEVQNKALLARINRYLDGLLAL
jgi:ribosome-binding protein aMBF1 (putative translation factor)